MATKLELQYAAAQNHAAATTYTQRTLLHLDALRENMLDLAALELTPPVIDPPVIDPPVIDPPVIDPPVIDLGDFGYDGDPADLASWVATQSGQGGRPESVEPWASGNTMRGFNRINPIVDGLLLGTHMGLANGSPGQIRRLVVELFMQTYWNKWGVRDDEIQQLLMQAGTVLNHLGTPQSGIEHWGYFGVEGWAPGEPHAYADYRDERFVLSLDPAWGVTDPFAEGGVTWASLLLRDLAISDVHRCGIQQVQRDFHKGSQDARNPETFDSDMGPIVLQHLLLRNINVASGSGSAISLFAPEWWGDGEGTPGHRSARRASQGAVLLDVHVDNAMQATCDGAGFAQSKKYVVHQGCSFVAGGPTNRPLYKVENVDGPVTLIDSRYDTEGGQDVVDLINCTGPVNVLNCKGTARLRINGVDKGVISSLPTDIRS